MSRCLKPLDRSEWWVMDGKVAAIGDLPSTIHHPRSTAFYVGSDVGGSNFGATASTFSSTGVGRELLLDSFFL